LPDVETIDPFWAVRTLEFVTSLEAVATCGDAMELFRREIARIGFSSHVMIAVDERDFSRRLIASGLSPEWIAIYADRNWKDADPVRRQVSRAANPFFWSEVRYDPEREPRASEVMQCAADFRMKEGFCLPIRDGNSIAAVSISGEKPDRGPGVRAALQIISLFTYNRCRAIIRPPAASAKKLLTPREREALRWVSIGKSDWDISEILNISERTARFHVVNAVHKLKAANRSAAVVEAVKLGEISLFN
jgi:LuxR family quorum sensing-dependent transcriptional regulator